MNVMNKMIKSMKTVLAALVVGGLACAASAIDEGSIYSIDLVSGGTYGGLVPSEDSPLTIGQTAVVRVRLLNSNWTDPSRASNVKSWRVSPTTAYATMSESLKAAYPLKLGFMFGGQPAYAEFVEAVPLATPAGFFTDLYFKYQVKSGDLAMPAQLMNTAGQAASASSSSDYYLMNTMYWQIDDVDGAQAVFHFMSETTSGLVLNESGTTASRSVTGTGLNLYVKTVDFDTNYVVPAETAGDAGVWRRFHQGLTTTSSTQPTVVVNGTPESAQTLYVWVEDETVAQPLVSDGAELVTDTGKDADGNAVTYSRYVLPVSFAVGADVTKTFRLKGLAIGSTTVRMSSSKNLVFDDMGQLKESWVSRPIEVITPPAPYASIEILDPSGANALSSVTVSTNYQGHVAVMKLTLNGATPTDAVKMEISSDQPVCPEAEADRRIGLSTSADAGDIPWLDRVTSVTFAAGETEKFLYVYALDQTEDLAGKVTFTPVLSGAGAADYTGDAKTASFTVKPSKPVIVSPTAGAVLGDAIAGEVYTLDLVLGDSYRQMRANGWKLQIRCTALGSVSGWKTFSNIGSVDKDTGEISPNVTFAQAKDAVDIDIRVVDPQGQTSDAVKAKITVTAPKTAKATFDRGSEQYAESRTETAKAYFQISQPSDSSEPLYAYLMPINDDATNKVSSTAFTTSDPNTGVYIAPGELDSGSNYATLRLRDGDCTARYKVVICTTETYDETKVASYVAGQCNLVVTNVTPTIRSVSMGGSKVKATDASRQMKSAIAQGLTKKFTIDVDDPGELDLTAAGDDAFCVKWNFGDGSDDVLTWGNPATNSLERTFTTPGTFDVTVQCQDKDMRATGLWTEEFTFSVSVLDAPAIEVVQSSGLTSLYEDQATSAYGFNVNLNVAPSFANASDRLVVDLAVVWADSGLPVSDDDCTLSRTSVSFASGATTGQTFYLKTLDGTAESSGSGFRIVATARDSSDTEGKTWASGELDFLVHNRAPTINQPIEQGTGSDGKQITAAATINESQTLAWSVSDVKADRAGLVVKWTTSEGKSVEYRQKTGAASEVDTDTVKYLDNVLSGTHSFFFTGSGDKSVALTVTDKDGGQATVRYYYTITASKTLEILPHGPSSGNGTTLSAKYNDRASGLGEGKVWTSNAEAQISNWTFTYGCGLSSTFRVYASGFRVGDTDPRVTAAGGAAGTGSAGYAYPDAKYDSFFYCWLQLSTEEGKATLTDSVASVSPEQPGKTATATAITLPTEKDDDGNYATTILEAIFSRETYASDNMGDINADGIPDAYVKKYGMGVFDDEGTLTGNDLSKLASYNEDNDTLPSDGDLADEQPFTARLEIRGYGEALNDAPTLAGLAGYEPERRYTDPAADDDSTLTALEYLAWTEYAAANGLDPDSETSWAQWSPERPSDPTTDDTDEDGFSDGFEYYYWYKAHVGYLDGNGVHCYLTGRRLDPKNPDGTVIPSADIEALMDPLTAYGDQSNASTRDSDNDGLPDLLEFELGTNPFDFDSDGDGLPDGYEVIVCGTDPLKYATDGTTCDAELNRDGDHMAYTDVFRALDEGDVCSELTWLKVDGAITNNVVFLTSFAVADASLGENGVQWYVVPDASKVELSETTCSAVLTTLEVYDGSGLWTEDDSWQKVAVVGDVKFADAGAIGGTDVKRVAVDVEAAKAFVIDEGEGGAIVRGLPKRIARGSFARNIDAASEYVERSIAADIDSQGNACNRAWIYGTTAGGYGELAIGPTQSVAAASVVLAAPANTRKVAYVHSYVYQQFGFDPRTAWSSTSPFFSSRDNAASRRSGRPMRTRPFTAYDEYLVLSYYLNSGALTEGELTPTKKTPWSTIYSMYATNPRGPDEETAELSTTNTVDLVRFDQAGADTDGDGVPDGWELYVMSGAKDANGNFRIKGPDAAMSPTNPDIGSDSSQDNDGLGEPEEFAGYTSICAYTNVCDTITLDTLGNWVNKLLPTDPWNADTDGDGLTDGEEKSAFAYGSPLENENLDTSLFVPGGGLNPCSVDTDMDGLPDGWELQFAGTYVAPSSEELSTNATAAAATTITNGMDGTFSDALLDYDHDGLENWQEYMVGAMRCWRYDDPYSPWTPIEESKYFQSTLFGRTFSPDLAALGCASLDEFWYKTLMDKTSGIYNPHLVTDVASASLYFSHVTNAWDVVYKVNGLALYMFKDRVDDTTYNDLFGKAFAGATGQEVNSGAPFRYISCSPIKADTDQDGMDDYYELFHGLNPLLGAAGVVETVGGGDYAGRPCDIVYSAWCGDKVANPAPTAYLNAWLQASESDAQEDPASLDYVSCPWLNGMAQADPDGDDVRNQDEAILARVGGAAGYHTDPSPLWMTDMTYTNSLTARFYQRPSTGDQFLGMDPVTFSDGTNDHAVVDFPGFEMTEKDGFVSKASAAGFSAYGISYMFSFEQTEGYDTDGDFYGDRDEISGKFSRASTDPLLADSPQRRQAMYFQGPAKKSMAIQAPFSEIGRADGTKASNEMALSQFTAECWVCPETLDDATILERTVNVSWSHPADEDNFRRNFNLSVKDGMWYAFYESNGTLESSPVAVFSKSAVETNVWTHLAATYDGTALRLYVNGQVEGRTASGIRPCNGTSYLTLYSDGRYVDDDGAAGIFVIGASAEAAVTSGKGIDSDAYSNFFTGYVDEVRVWDGARSASEIKSAKDTRYTMAMVQDNHETVYDEWLVGKRRYEKDANGDDYEVTPELRYHYSFDSLAAAENEAQVAKEPHGFGATGDKPPAGRPADYACGFWSDIVKGRESGKKKKPYGSVYDSVQWIPWIPNTVAQQPRLDGLTTDSQYWTADFGGATPGVYKFPRTAEPYIGYYQATRSDSVTRALETRQDFFAAAGGTFSDLYDFESRHRTAYADALLPVGGAYARYVPASLGLWDGQGASSVSPFTGRDSDNDGLPDWWEAYAEENYRRADMDPAEFIGWETIVDYNGRSMTAGEAYLYDIAHGAYVDADGNAHVAADDAAKKAFVQTACTGGVGIPDWWMELYGIMGESALDDHDHDGLSNYHEFILSEVFNFKGLVFDPTDAFSVDRYTPDYFYRVGSLYVGEIFTDHDLVDDDWEDAYDAAFASRLAYDAFADKDEDGWSNRSENRYTRQCQPIVANYSAHYSATDGLVRDHPIPTLNVKLRYNGARRAAVENASIVVCVRSEAHKSHVSALTDPDATYSVSGGTTSNTTDEDGEEGSGTAYTKTLGKWSARHALGTMTPGAVNQDSVELQFCSDPSVLTYRWYYLWEYHMYGRYVIYTGTAKDLSTARNKYGDDNVIILDKTTAYQNLTGYNAEFDDTTQILTWTVPSNNKTLATFNLVTGAYDIDFNALKGQYASSTNGTSDVSLEDQTYRLSYLANPSVGLPRTLYLGQATSGYVREGKNTVLAFADLDGDGEYDAGEPMGVVRGVNVSWRASDLAEIELVETNPVFARYNLVDGTTDREATWAAGSTGVAETGSGTVSTDADQRVRVVRYAIDNIRASGYEGTLAAQYTAVVYDGVLRTSGSGSLWLTEDDILSSVASEFDLDWDATRYASDAWTLSDLYKNVYAPAGTDYQVTNVYYAVVLGNGPIYADNPTATNFMGKMIARSFDLNRRRPTLISPTGVVGGTGAANDTVVYDAAPTFQWTMNGNTTYTAFRLQVLKDETVVYDSGYQRMPPTDDQGRCSWTAPVYAGDKTTLGQVVENNRVYSWKLSVYNAKFRDDDFVTSEPYYLNVQTNHPFYGSQRVAVRYFGPKESYAGKTIHVQAFESPDFTGRPVASGYVAAPDDADCGVSVTGKVVQANATLIGIPKGTYYLRAYVDSNDNGVWDSWETMGYLCARDGTASNTLDPLALSFADKSGAGEVVQIFLEDADTDQDGLPDAWEYATYGSLTAKGVELLAASPEGQVLTSTSLSGVLSLLDGANVPESNVTGQFQSALSSAGTVALALGLSAPTTGSFAENITAAISPELAEDGVSVSSIAIEDGQVKLVLQTETSENTTTAGNAFVSSVSLPDALTVTCTVYHTPSLAEDWSVLKTQTLTIGLGSQTETLSLPAETDATSGFYKVEITK